MESCTNGGGVATRQARRGDRPQTREDRPRKRDVRHCEGPTPWEWRASALHVHDADAEVLVERIQAGDEQALTELYLRYFDRLYAYLRVVMRDSADAEDGAQDVFVRVIGAIARYERREQPFEAWLFSIARNHATNLLRKRSRLEIEDPRIIEGRCESAPGGAGLDALGWSADGELLTLIERLSLMQRQVLMLRYMMGFSAGEIGQILERSPEAIRQLHRRSLAFLEERLTALADGRSRAGGGESSSSRAELLSRGL